MQIFQRLFTRKLLRNTICSEVVFSRQEILFKKALVPCLKHNIHHCFLSFFKMNSATLDSTPPPFYFWYDWVITSSVDTRKWKKKQRLYCACLDRQENCIQIYQYLVRKSVQFILPCSFKAVTKGKLRLLLSISVNSDLSLTDLLG